MEEQHIAFVARRLTSAILSENVCWEDITMLKFTWLFVVIRNRETAHLQNFGPQQNSSNKEHHVWRVGTGLKEQA